MADSDWKVVGPGDLPSATSDTGDSSEWKPVDQAAFQTMHHNFWEDHLQNAAQKAYDIFAHHGHEDLGQAAYDLIYKGGPHSTTDAVLMGLTALMPGIGKAAPEVAEEASPILRAATGYLRSLGGEGFKAAAARTGTAAGVGAATSAATGDSPLQGAVTGATMNVGAEVPAAAERQAGRIYNAATGSPEPLGGALGTLRGEPQVAAAAGQASGKAVEAGQAEAEKLQGAAGKEATKQGQAESKAVDETAEANMKARAKEYQKAKETIAAGQGQIEQNAQTLQDKVAAETERAAQQSVGGIRDRIIQQATGRLPEQTQAAIHAPGEAGELADIPGPEFVARRQAMQSAAYEPARLVGDELSRQYDATLGPFMDKPVPDVAPANDSVLHEQNWGHDNSVTFSAPIRKLFDDVTELTGGGIRNPNFNINTPEGMAQAETVLKRAGWGQKQLDEYTPQEKLIEARNQLKLENANVTVAQMRGLRSRASALFASSTDASDKAAALAIRDGIEKSLESSGIPGVKELNAKYATFKNLFGRDFYHGIAKAKDPIDAAPLLFNEPQRAARLANNANPDQLSTLREIYGDWVNREGNKVVDIKTQGPLLQKLFPGTKLADPQSWIHLPDKMVKASDLMADDPEFNQQVVQLAQTERTKAATQITQQLLDQAQKLGDAGRPIIQAAQQAKTPEDAARSLIQSFTGMSPEDAVRTLASTQVSPEEAARSAGAGAPRVARSVAAGYQPPSPQEAALSSVQQGQMASAPGSGGAHMLLYARRMWPLFATLAGWDALMGHTPSPWHMGMASMGLVLKGSDLLQRSFLNSLKDPANAERFLSAVQTPTLPASKGIMARGIVRMLGTVGMNVMTNDAPGPKPAASEINSPMSPEPPGLDKQPLPTLDVAWHKARDAKDTVQAKEIRDIVVRRMKAGEWKNLDPNMKRQLTPFIREIAGING